MIADITVSYVYNTTCSWLYLFSDKRRRRQKNDTITKTIVNASTPSNRSTHFVFIAIRTFGRSSTIYLYCKAHKRRNDFRASSINFPATIYSPQFAYLCRFGRVYSCIPQQ